MVDLEGARAQPKTIDEEFSWSSIPAPNKVLVTPALVMENGYDHLSMKEYTSAGDTCLCIGLGMQAVDAKDTMLELGPD